MYCQKNYLCSLVIEQDEWDRLSDPAYLAHYWEPTQEPGDFHQTFALAICWSCYSDCKDPSRKDEYVVSVAVIQKPAGFAGIPFALAADSLSNPDEKESTLLIVCLHYQSRLFLDIYYDRYYSHFTMMHMSGEHYNVGHPQKYVEGLLHNAYEAGEESHSPKAKLPLSFVESTVYLFPVDSCVQPYQKKHHRRPRSELKVTNCGEVRDSLVWSQGGPSSSLESSASGVDSGFSSTQKQQGVNTAGATILQGDRTSLLSPATVKKLDARDYDDDPLSDHPDYKPSDDDQEMAIVEEQPRTIIGDGETGPKETGMGKKDTGCNLGNPVDAQDPVLTSTSTQQLSPTRPGTGALASASAVEMRALTSPALAITMAQIQEATATSDDNDDTNEEKARLDAYKGVMWGLHEASHTLSEGYQLHVRGGSIHCTLPVGESSTTGN